MIPNRFGTEEAPEGFTLPRAAVKMLTTAALAKWLTGWQWSVDSGGNPFVSIHVGDRETGEYFKYVWHTRGTGTLRLFSRTHRATRGRQWTDGPGVADVIFRIREVESQRS